MTLNRFVFVLLYVCSVGLFSSQANADSADAKEIKKAIFAGGCFWCMEPPFDALDGVISTTSGYIGGSKKTANYKKVSAGGTGHYEAIEIEYDPAKVSFDKLLEVFWVNVDPYDDRGQFCDKGSQYLSGIFYLDDEQKQAALKSKAKTARALPYMVVTEVIEASPFYAAEAYHQNYYQRNSLRYKFYRKGCGRDNRLFEVWGEAAKKNY